MTCERENESQRKKKTQILRLEPNSNPNEHIVSDVCNTKNIENPWDIAENSTTLGHTCETFSFESSDFRRLCDFGLFRTNIAIS